MVDFDKVDDEYTLRDLVSDLESVELGDYAFARKIQNSINLQKIGEGSHRTVYKHPKLGDYVIKVARESTIWANERENEVSNKGTTMEGEINVPREIVDKTAIISAYDRWEGGPRWIVMENLDTRNVTKQDGRDLWRFMLERGWGVEDFRKQNIGLREGEPMMIDYTYLKPLDKMLPKPRKRVESGQRWL